MSKKQKHWFIVNFEAGFGLYMFYKACAKLFTFSWLQGKDLFKISFQNVIYSKLRHTWSSIYYLPLISLSSLLSFRFFQYIIICLARLCEDEMRWLLRDAWDITHGQTFASFYIFLHKSLFYHSQRWRNSQGRVVALTVERGTWNIQGTAEILTSIMISRLMCALHTILTSYLPKMVLPIYWVVFFLRSYYSYQNGDL